MIKSFCNLGNSVCQLIDLALIRLRGFSNVCHFMGRWKVSIWPWVLRFRKAIVWKKPVWRMWLVSILLVVGFLCCLTKVRFGIPLIRLPLHRLIVILWGLWFVIIRFGLQFGWIVVWNFKMCYKVLLPPWALVFWL